MYRMLAVWESDEQEAIAVHFQDRVVDPVSETYSGLLKPGAGEEVEVLGPEEVSVKAGEEWMEDNSGVATGKAKSDKKGHKSKKKRSPPTAKPPVEKPLPVVVREMEVEEVVEEVIREEGQGGEWQDGSKKKKKGRKKGL